VRPALGTAGHPGCQGIRIRDEQADRKSGATLLPSLTDVAFVLPIVLLFAKLGGISFLLGIATPAGTSGPANGSAERPNSDRDIFSFTKAGQPWFAWEWLWDAIFGWMHQRWAW